jgi:hypothetical protein
MIKDKLVSYLLLLLMPMVYGITYKVIGDQNGPYWFTPNQDPDYAYFFNALNVLNLNTPAHTDHPGTPLQILGAVVIKITYSIQSLFQAQSENINESVLRNSELYLSSINNAIILITALSIYVVGFITFKVSKNLAISIVLQTTPLLASELLLMRESSRVAPENLLFFISQLLIILLILFLYVEGIERRNQFAIALGIVFGIGMATKVTYITMGLYFLLISGIKRKVLAIAIAVISFVLGTLPIISQYPRVARWLFGIATHTGAHGRGDKGLVNPSTFWTLFSGFVSENLFFFSLIAFITIVCGFSLFKRWKRALKSPNLINPTLLSLSKLQLLTVLTVLGVGGQIFLGLSKGGETVQSRYFIPAASLFGLMILLAILLLSELLSANSQTEVFLYPHRSITLFVLVCCLAFGMQQLYSSSIVLSERYEMQTKDLATIQKSVFENPNYQNCTRVKLIRSSSVEAALFYGDVWWGGKHFSNILAQIYPNQIFLNPRDREKDGVFESHNRAIDEQNIFRGNQACVLLETDNLDPKVSERLSKYIDIRGVYLGPMNAVHQITLHRSKQ